MKKNSVAAICIAIVTVFIAADSLAAETVAPKEGLNIGDTFLNYHTFSAKTIDGKTFKLADAKGKFLFIDFWATWCKPCLFELPYVTHAYDTYVGDRLAMVGISLDKSLDALRATIEADGLAYPQICDEKGWQSEHAKTFGIRSIPANFLLDGNGVIIAKNLRGLTLEGHIARALGLEAPVVHYLEALEYGEANNVEKALAAIEKALEADPDCPEYHFLFARILMASNTDHEKAIEHLTTGLDHTDRLIAFMPVLEAYVMLAHLTNIGGDKAKAGALLDEAIAAIQALPGSQKSLYEPFIAQIEKLKADWQLNKPQN